MKRLLSFVALVVALIPLRAFAAEPSAQWVVVAAPAFRDAVQPLADHRKSQNFRVVSVQAADFADAGKLRQHVNALCRDFKGTSYVLLVGAVASDKAEAVVPPLTGSVGRMKGQPTDNGYGCPGEGLQPAVAVGRFPARTEAECKAMVAKTIAFEKDDQPGPWRRQLTVLAGVPAFNPVVDKLVERMAISRFDRIDPAWSGRALYHNPQSHFTVPDEMVRARALEMVKPGAAFTLYLGHSNAEGFWAGESRYLDRDDWSALKMERPGVFVTFGCNGCQLSGRDGEGYGVWAVRNPNGPVAALGSHGICFAAMVELASSGLFEKALQKTLPERLGEAWLGLKEGLARGRIDPITYRLLDAVDGDSGIKQDEQRLEHLEMFVLLGDPALKLPQLAGDVKLNADETVKPGDSLVVKGEVPRRLEGAKVLVTLERTPGSDPADLEPLPKEARERAKAVVANHERANTFVLGSAEAVVRDGKFEVKVEVPKTLPWKRVLLRAHAATAREEGQGVLTLTRAEE